MRLELRRDRGSFIQPVCGDLALHQRESGEFPHIRGAGFECVQEAGARRFTPSCCSEGQGKERPRARIIAVRGGALQIAFSGNVVTPMERFQTAGEEIILGKSRGQSGGQQ